MPAPDVRYFLDGSIECGHIAGDVYHYFMEMAPDANEVLDAYNSTETFDKHWHGLADTGMYLENIYIDRRAKKSGLDRLSPSFRGLTEFNTILKSQLFNASDVAVSNGFVRWTPGAEDLLNKEFAFGNSMKLLKRSITRASQDFDGFTLEDIKQVREKIEAKRHAEFLLQQEQMLALRSSIGADLLSEEGSGFGDRLSVMSSSVEINKAKRKIQERVKKERGVIKRSARFLSKLIGDDATRMYVGGHALVIEGKHAIYELKKKSNLMNSHGGFAALSVFDKDNPDIHLCDLCIYTDGVPLLDHIASLVMHIRTGHEDEILRVGNATNCSTLAYEKKWLSDYLPSRMSSPDWLERPLWFDPTVIKNKHAKIQSVYRDLQRMAYEEVLSPRRALLENITNANKTESVYYNTRVLLPNHFHPTEPDTDWEDIDATVNV